MTGVHGILVNENNGMIVVQECKKCLSEIVVHYCFSTSIVFMLSARVCKHTSFSATSIMGA